MRITVVQCRKVGPVSVVCLILTASFPGRYWWWKRPRSKAATGGGSGLVPRSLLVVGVASFPGVTGGGSGLVPLSLLAVGVASFPGRYWRWERPRSQVLLAVGAASFPGVTGGGSGLVYYKRSNTGCWNGLGTRLTWATFTASR